MASGEWQYTGPFLADEILVDHHYRASAVAPQIRTIPVAPASGSSNTTNPDYAPSALAVGSPQANSLTVSWDPVSWSGVHGAVTYELDRADNPGFSGADTFPLAGTSLVDDDGGSGLSGSTQYWYRVRALRGSTPAITSAAVAGTTAAGPPTAPTGLTSTGVTTTTVDLSWNPVAGATEYKIFRDFGGTPIATVPVPSTTHTDTGLAPGTTYTYEVVASHGADSPRSTPHAAVTALAAPTGLTSTGVTTTTVDLSWNPAVAATEYKLFRDFGGTPIATVAAPATTFTDTGLASGTTYTYEAVASNGFDSPRSTPHAAMTALATPGGLAVSAGGPYSLDLSWNAATGATAYEVWRDNGAGGAITYRTDVAAPSYSDDGLPPATTYRYQVLAKNSGGTSPLSSVRSGTTSTPGGSCTLDFEVSGNLANGCPGVTVTIGGGMEWHATGGGHIYNNLYSGDDFVYLSAPQTVDRFRMNVMPYQGYPPGSIRRRTGCRCTGSILAAARSGPSWST